MSVQVIDNREYKSCDVLGRVQVNSVPFLVTGIEVVHLWDAQDWVDAQGEVDFGESDF